MKTQILSVAICIMAVSNFVSADTFGTGDNQFTIDFVPISAPTRTGNVDYRIGKYEVTNDQWNKFKSEYGTVAGTPTTAYNTEAIWSDAGIPVNNVSWYEALQFVNYLNTITGHHAAYSFTGTQGTSNYTFTPWAITDAGYDASKPYRNLSAFYFLPTSWEWSSAAYWNGTTKQTYATVDNSVPVAGVYSNYDNAIGQPWAVGSGSLELNGTFDMMGNVWEWNESSSYADPLRRFVCGGSYYGNNDGAFSLMSSRSYHNYPEAEYNNHGFRVASVPEPTTLIFLFFGGLGLLKRKLKSLGA